ncbi:MAG: hypothetical protein OXG60_17330 [Chloroflexi bacterium]|nr:hypothetical protein [Chloroflexota bacterium]
MAWTTPKTDWATGELITASDMNAVGENLAALNDLATAVYTTTEHIRAKASEFTDVDSDNLSLTIATAGRDVLVHFYGTIGHGSASPNFYGSFDIDVDGVRQGSDDGVVKVYFYHDVYPCVSFTRLIQGLSAGSHTFKLQWKSYRSGMGLMLHKGAQFSVREI